MEINRKFFIHSIDILKGYKEAFKKMISINNASNLTNSSVILDEIYNELNIFSSQYSTELSLIFGEYNDAVPVKVIKNLESPLVVIQSLSNYIEGLTEEFQMDDEYYTNIEILTTEFSKFLESKLYDIEDMNIFPYNLNEEF
jgi:hypothetical protein